MLTLVRISAKHLMFYLIDTFYRYLVFYSRYFIAELGDQMKHTDSLNKTRIPLGLGVV